MKEMMAYYKVGYEGKNPETRVVGYITMLWGYLAAGNEIPSAVPTFA